MLAHRLRHRICFQEQVEMQDPVSGAPLIEWVTVVLGETLSLDKVPAEVLTGPGREFIESAAKQAETSARIRLRWFSGLKQSWRILWDGNIYNIVSIETDITARREYYLRCEAGVNDGQ